MKELGVHHSFMYHSYPDEPLLVVFDIDDTRLKFSPDRPPGGRLLHILRQAARHANPLGPVQGKLFRGDENHLHQLSELPLSKREGKHVMEAPVHALLLVANCYCGRTCSLPRRHGGHRMVAEAAQTFVGLNTRPASRCGNIDCLNRRDNPG